MGRDKLTVTPSAMSTPSTVAAQPQVAQLENEQTNQNTSLTSNKAKDIPGTNKSYHLDVFLTKNNIF